MKTMEKGMGRKFAREWYNINRAILIAEHQRRMDAKRTPMDLYMERFFQCADPSAVADENQKMSMEDLVAQVRAQVSADFSCEEQVAPKKAKKVAQGAPGKHVTAAPKKIDAPVKAAVVPQGLSEFDMAVGFFEDIVPCDQTKPVEQATPDKQVTAEPKKADVPMKAAVVAPHELTEFDIAVGFFEDFGTCNYPTVAV